MKCSMKTSRYQMIVMFIGLALMFAGIAAALAMGEDGAPGAFRLAGFAAGLGFALATACGVWLIWKRIAGKSRAQDKELEMGDERGQAINTRAQAMIGFVATFALIAINIVALVRGDGLYMALCTAGCFAVAFTGFISRAVLGKKM